MILAIDMGNSNIVVGGLDDNKTYFEERSCSFRHHGIRQIPLHLLKLQDILLNGVLRDEFEYGDLILLPDPVARSVA